jgi:hypothetical protein
MLYICRIKNNNYEIQQLTRKKETVEWDEYRQLESVYKNNSLLKELIKL